MHGSPLAARRSKLLDRAGRDEIAKSLRPPRSRNSQLNRIISDEIPRSAVIPERDSFVYMFSRPYIGFATIDVSSKTEEDKGSSIAKDVIVIDAYEKRRDSSYLWCYHEGDYIPINLTRILNWGYVQKAKTQEVLEAYTAMKNLVHETHLLAWNALGRKKS